MKKICGTNIYRCDYCDFETNKKSKWDRHLSTQKHKNKINEPNVVSIVNNKNENSVSTSSTISTISNISNTSNGFVCECGKKYSYKQSFIRHKNICSFASIVTNDKVKTEIKNETIDNNLVKDIINENKELRTILKQQQEQISELIPKIGNTTNNNTTNKFNLNVFLNERCKDALNLEDFVQSIQLKLGDLEDTARLGYVDGMTNIIVRGLNDLAVTKRPIHYSDPKRDVLYVKDNNSWEKESSKSDKMKRAIELINRSNIKQIPTWVAKNPECNDIDDPKNEIYMSMITETLDDDEEKQDKINNKIVKNIARSVIIDENK